MKVYNLFKRLPLNLAFKILFLKAIKKIFSQGTQIHFSQTGEDILIAHLLEQKKDGFYLDVGCNHPIVYSNTFLLYLNGWTGCCIDANEDLVKKYKKARLLDTVVYAAVSDEEKEVKMFLSDQTLVTTINEAFRDTWHKDWVSSEKVKLVKTKRLDTILDENKFRDRKIDLLSIDVEGNDLKVLTSIDLKKYQPQLIVIEMHDFSIEKKEESPIYQYLKLNGYSLVNFATMNGYFVRTEKLSYE